MRILVPQLLRPRRRQRTIFSCATAVAVALSLLVVIVARAHERRAEEDHRGDDRSARSRNVVATASRATSPSSPSRSIRRQSFPEPDPHVCLAFLSCCGRTDLLDHAIAGAVRHMEEDEPSWLRYEIAWVDNGSENGDDSDDFDTPVATTTLSDIEATYPIEHALLLKQNMGLAYGMNLLIFNLCTAPYILLLEEDWLYADDVVATQTVERKRAVATGIALTERLRASNATAFDGRPVLGVFLRHESYERFLYFPHADVWETVEDVNLKRAVESSIVDREVSGGNSSTCRSDGESPDGGSNARDSIVDIDYRIFCADTGFRSGMVWGSYTNGAGLYRRKDLIENVGRMYGEPGDAFHDRYVESNYAYRVGLRYCQAAVRLTTDRTCNRISDFECAGAFQHIGGGRGTRPRSTDNTKCEDQAWHFYGTTVYDKYQKYKAMTGQAVETCSATELEELRERRFRDVDSEAYREETKRENAKVFEQERKQRETMREQARLIESTDNHLLREQVEWLRDMSDEEIAAAATRLRKMADSPHPLKGFWDSHGRIVEARE